MTYYLVLIASVAGLLIGSFINAAVPRLRARDGNFFTGRSECPQCKHPLATKDLIPVVSYLLLGGKCRYCAQAIGMRYLLVELITGFIFGLTAYAIGDGSIPLLIWDLLLVGILMFLAVYDALYREIPDEVSLPAIIIAIIVSLFGLKLHWDDSLIGLTIGGGFFLSIILLNGLAKHMHWSDKEWLGGGDIRLGALLGAALGWQGFLLALFLSSLTGTAVGLGLIAAKKADLQTAIPYGPYLALGGLIALLYGGELITWYIQIFTI